MNRTLQVQLLFVGISLLILVLVAFFPPSLRLAEVRFEQASADAERVSRTEERRRRQQEVGAEHAAPDLGAEGGGMEPAPSGGEVPVAGNEQVTEDSREGGGDAPAAADPTPPMIRATPRPRPAQPRRTPVPEVVDEAVEDAGEPENETIF